MAIESREPVWLRRKCLREMPEFPDGLMHLLEPHFQDQKLCGDRCPHQGFSLKGFPVAEDGTIVCPLHGLKWDTKTGAMVSRLKREEPETLEVKEFR